MYGVLNASFESKYPEINTIFTYLTLFGRLTVSLSVFHFGTGLLVCGFYPNWDFPWIYIFVRQYSIWLRLYYGRWLASHAVTGVRIPVGSKNDFSCLLIFQTVTCWEPGFDPGHWYHICSRR